MIDIAGARQAYERRQISKIGWIRSRNNLADAFTKPKRCPSLESYLHDGHLQVDVVQCVNSSAEGSTASSEPGSATIRLQSQHKNSGPHTAATPQSTTNCTHAPNRNSTPHHRREEHPHPRSDLESTLEHVSPPLRHAKLLGMLDSVVTHAGDRMRHDTHNDAACYPAAIPSAPYSTPRSHSPTTSTPTSASSRPCTL